MSNSSSYLKASIDGMNGAGKSGTALRIILGISKEMCSSAPVVAYSSDDRWRFYKRMIFDREGVPLHVVSGESLTKVREALDLADEIKPCAVVFDDLTKPWKEGVASFSYEDGYLPFERREQLMREWRPVLQGFREGEFHAIGIGRLGYIWENIADENGRMRLTQGDSKFNAGGGENFGYEADLELEMRRRKRLSGVKNILTRKLTTQYVCDVVKDATIGVLNSQQFVFDAQDGLYKPGGYKPVFECFREYLRLVQDVEAPNTDHTSSKKLIVAGKTQWAKDQSVRKGLLEELDATLTLCFPGGEKHSKLDQMFRNLTLEALNGYISWSRMEEEVPTIDLQRKVQIVKALWARIQKGEKPTDHNSLIALHRLAVEDVVNPANDMTLLEVMTMNRPRKAQPVVEVMDAAHEEIGAD